MIYMCFFFIWWAHFLGVFDMKSGEDTKNKLLLGRPRDRMALSLTSLS